MYQKIIPAKYYYHCNYYNITFYYDNNFSIYAFIII